MTSSKENQNIRPLLKEVFSNIKEDYKKEVSEYIKSSHFKEFLNKVKKKILPLGLLTLIALSGCATTDSVRKGRPSERESVTSEDGTFTRKTGETNYNETIYDGWKKNKGGEIVATEMIFDTNSDGLFNGKDSYHYVSKTSDEKKCIIAESADKENLDYAQKRLDRMISAFEKKGAPGKTEDKPKLEGIIAQCMDLGNKVLIKAYDNKQLGEQLKGGELRIYSADKSPIYDKAFSDNEAVEIDTSRFAAGKYRIIYSKAGKSCSTKLILEEMRWR